MAANEASRLRNEHAQPRAEEGSAARPLAREPSPEVARNEAREQEADAEEAEHGSEALAALERAAENIRPSWHGAELPPAPPTSGEIYAAQPAALPPPPALPSFSSFPIEQSAPHYRVDTTVRTAAVLPERLAQLLTQPQLARARSRALRQIADASHWLRARPWARAGLALAAVLALAWSFWPSAPEAPVTIVAKPKLVHSAPAAPIVPAPRAAQEPQPAAAASAAAAEQPAAESPAVGVKKRDKRKAPSAKATSAKASSTGASAKASSTGATVKAAATIGSSVKPAPGKAPKPGKAAATPAR